MRTLPGFLLTIAVSFSLFPIAHAGAAKNCEALFSNQQDERAAKLRYLEMVSGVPLDDRMTPAEEIFALELASSNQLGIDKLYGRFDELSRFLRNDLAFGANKRELLKLATSSLVTGTTAQATENSIGELLLNAGSNAEPSQRRRLQIPHSVILQLTEAQVRLKLSTDDVATVYNKWLLKLRTRRVRRASPSLGSPATEAAALTLNELERNAGRVK